MNEAFDPTLLELHLGHLSEEEQAQLLARIRDDADLARQNEAVQALFERLKLVRDEPSVPADLAERVVAHVHANADALRVVRPADSLTRTIEREQRLRLYHGSLRDILAIAAVIVLMVGLGVPSVLHVRSRNQRIGCSQNLAQLGQSMQRYAASHASNLPFAGWEPTMRWKPTADGRATLAHNRRHMYPLLQGAFVQNPRIFICPSRWDVPMAANDVSRHQTFPESRNVSYAYYNMAGVRPTLEDDPTLPILSDDNPLFEDGTPLIEFRRRTSSDPTQINSGAHRAAGQNVLSLDGGVRWRVTPLVGIEQDNIWTLEGVSSYTGAEGPQSTTDAHLIK